MGCPSKEFWYGDPKILWIYAKAFKDKQKFKAKVWQQQVNTAAWIQGQYIMAAIGACLSDSCHYPEQPQKLFGDESQEGNSEGENSNDNSADEGSIRAQSMRVDRALATQEKPQAVIIGKKRT